MRNFVLAAAVVLVFSGCSTYYNHIIESDYSYEGNFNRYKTFNFVAKEDFEGTDRQREAIEKYLNKNLELWGYKRKEKKPNLVVFYNLYMEDLRFTGYRQPDFENWVKWNFSNKLIATQEDSLVQIDDYLGERRGSYYRSENYDQIKYQLKEGTLLISLYDRRKNKTIWQGYASGVLGEDEFRNDRIIRHIVSRIMDKYRVLAVGSFNL